MLIVAYLEAVATHLAGEDAADASARVEKCINAAPALAERDFSPLDRYLADADSADFPEGALARARAIQAKVHAAPATTQPDVQPPH